MPRIRSVHPDICTDQGLVGVSGDAERLYVRLWTHLDDDGRCEDDSLLLKAALFPRHRHIDEDDIERWVDELVQNGQLIRYERGGKRLITAKPDAWSTYQKPRRKVDSKLPAPTRADIVGTRADIDGQRPTGGGGVVGEGEEMESEKEGESEGEAERGSAYLRPVDNPSPVVIGLANRASSLAARCAERNPAAETEPLTSSSALTNGVGN